MFTYALGCFVAGFGLAVWLLNRRRRIRAGTNQHETSVGIPLFELQRLCNDWEERACATINANHPLALLRRSTDEQTRAVAQRSDAALAKIRRQFPQWLESKRRIVFQDEDSRNVAATLGEFRAFGELISIFGDQIRPQSSGADFVVEVGGRTVGIEVTTLQGSTKDTDRTISIRERVGIIIEETHRAPFGQPERAKDNVQGEAVSQLAAVKMPERQMTDEVAILWIDLQDPTAWPLGFGREQLMPVASWRESLTSGALWHALYAEKGDPIFDDLNTDGLGGHVYELEFPGRFHQASNVDFVVADLGDVLAVFQNHVKRAAIPNELFRCFFRLPVFAVNLSWIDWPESGELPTRADAARREVSAYVEAFHEHADMPEEPRPA